MIQKFVMIVKKIQSAEDVKLVCIIVGVLTSMSLVGLSGKDQLATDHKGDLSPFFY